MFPEAPYCACATPPGIGGIAVIRMSGKNAVEVADRVFQVIRASSPEVDSVQAMPGYSAAFGRLTDPKNQSVIDECILSLFRKPHSYTGEDVIEISCHGGTAVRQEILRVLIENGARAAEPGEFTKNAFLSGKIDLSQAESVMDVISAESTLALRAAETHLLGALKKEIRRASERIYEGFAKLEMIIEFPEHEDTTEGAKEVAARLSESTDSLRELARSYTQGRILKEKMNVVLCGVPNSGKSSLLNRLAGYDRAIVTPVAGTTRDTLEVDTSIEGIPVRLMDTAGLRDTMDTVEKIGVSRAFDAITNADLLLWLISPAEDTEDGDLEFFRRAVEPLGDARVGILVSKSDLFPRGDANGFLKRITNQIDQLGLSRKIRFGLSISSETGEGIAEIGARIRSLFDELGYGACRELLITNGRHYDRIHRAVERIEQAVGVINEDQPTEIACSLLRLAMDELGEITGDSVNESLVAEIFSRFCIGK
ncbi:MAG: tRNA uridine-5-carboxymethylaminomethyl(34) synthesis GTPase MnmE [Clostridiaceae bacterium]|nr:tRNA uridine-5-carboxymethylaminomethyl(34) synthesis GTPase MnmE [Clostridiaceae bacterium]